MESDRVDPEFKKGWCIALKTEAHRPEKIRQDMQKWCGMEVETLLVDRPNETFSNMHFPIAPETKRWGIQYYIGCGDSHRLCWERIAKSELGWYLVLESDVRVDFDNASTFESATNLLQNLIPADADIIALGSLFHLSVNSKWEMFLTSPLAWFTHEAFQQPIMIPQSRIINQHVRIPSVFAGGQGYALTPKGAQKLLDRLGTIRFHVDYEISAAVARDPTIRMYSTRVNVLRQTAQVEGKRPTYPMILNQVLDNWMCFDMSAAWLLTLPLCQVAGVPITAWSITLPVSCYAGLLFGFTYEHFLIGWLSAVLFWSLMSVPYNGHWLPLRNTIFFTVLAPLPPVLLALSLFTYKFVMWSRIKPPKKPSALDFPKATHPSSALSEVLIASERKE